ncbi:hypothetical protein ABZ815_20570 [Nonomuraea sp. NPDC047529]
MIYHGYRRKIGGSIIAIEPLDGVQQRARLQQKCQVVHRDGA